MRSWPQVQLRHIAQMKYGDSLATDFRIEGEIKVYGSNGPVGTHDANNTSGPVIVVGRKGSHGKLQWSSKLVFAIDTTYFIDESCTEADLRWLYFALQIVELETLTQDVGVPGLSRERAYSQRLPLPSPDEQRAIADYLDAETARIDALIEKKRRMLRLLEERRHSYLLSLLGSSGASQKNLEWLGSVPEDWPLVQIGVIADFYAGTTFPHSYQGESAGDLPFIKVGDLWSDEAGTVIDNANNWITRINALELRGSVVPASSVLYARVGEALRLNPRRLTNRPSLVDDNVRAIHFRYGDGRYWAELLTLLDLAQLANPGPVPSVSEGQVATIRVPMAPLQEQDRIADAMAREREVRSKVHASIIEQLDKLSEHRQALITAAVTGEVEVAQQQ